MGVNEEEEKHQTVGKGEAKESQQSRIMIITTGVQTKGRGGQMRGRDGREAGSENRQVRLV